MENNYVVIMAGGGGTRLWPLSRRDRPKQSLRLVGTDTLFQMAVERLLPLIPPDRILVVTVAEQVRQLREQCPSIPLANYIVEPSGKGTASVAGLAAIQLLHRNPAAVMAVLTADHVIRNLEVFRVTLRHAFEVAQQGELVTLGITPNYASTAYGYIQRGAKQTLPSGTIYYQVDRFKEKPSAEVAEEYLKSGEYYWNSGMFIWLAERILEEIATSMPILMKGLEQIQPLIGSAEERERQEQVWSQLTPQTIDYAIMEKAANVVVLPADDLGWYDIGGWAGLYEVLDRDENGNVFGAENTIVTDTHGTIVYQDDDETHRLIALLGIEDLVVVDTADAILICPREKAEEVRKIVRILSEQRDGKYS